MKFCPSSPTKHACTEGAWQSERSSTNSGFQNSQEVNFTGEVWFHITGYLASQVKKWQYCSFHDHGLWCGFMLACNWSLSFSQTVNTEHYQKVIWNFISLLEAKEWNCWSLQDAARAYTTNSTTGMLQETSSECKLLKMCLLDLWDCSHSVLSLQMFKNNVCRNKPHTLEELKQYNERHQICSKG
jgi:hypothetical protein